LVIQIFFTGSLLETTTFNGPVILLRPQQDSDDVRVESLFCKQFIVLWVRFALTVSLKGTKNQMHHAKCAGPV